MKLRDLVVESMIFDLRVQVGAVLGESVADYLSTAVAVLRAKKPEEIFGDSPKIDLEQMAKIITGLKVLSNKEYRDSITKDDVGLNVQSAKEVFDMLNNVPKDGKNVPKTTDDIFTALKGLVPSLYKKELEKLEQLKDGDESDRKKEIDDLAALTTKVGQMFQSIKSKSQGQQAAA